MKKTIITAISIIFFTILILSCVSQPAPPQGMTLVWSDEFDYTGLPDPRKWNYDTAMPGWVNDEKQQYVKERPENTRVENGKLIITACRDFYREQEYSSARIKTAWMGDWLYGRIEVRAKLPAGRGTWPAIWMLPSVTSYGGWPNSGEIDIMEHVGHEPGIVHASTHTKKYYWVNKNQKTAKISVPDFATAFHVYAMEWSPERIDIFVDDDLYFTNINEGTGWEAWPFNKPFHLILNVAVGGNWGGVKGIDNSIFPVSMEVDYVRVYQKK